MQACSGWGTPGTAGRIGSPCQCADWCLWRWTGPPTKKGDHFNLKIYFFKSRQKNKNKKTTFLYLIADCLILTELNLWMLFYTLKSRKIILWWAFDKTGKPFLLVRKMLVGRMAALIGSPSHLSITVSDGISGPISTALGIQTKHNLSNRQQHNYFSMPEVCPRLLLHSVFSHQDRFSCCSHKGFWMSSTYEKKMR